VPHRLPGAVACSLLLESAPDAGLLQVPLVGRFLVRGEGPVLVEREGSPTDADLRCFADEPVAAAAAVLRGERVLRGASVSIGGRVVALCGPSGAGKSALAAALAQRGHAMLADAVTAIGAEPRVGSPLVRPIAPEPVLWPDSVEELGLRDLPFRRVRPALAKRAYQLPRASAPGPLAAVAFLRSDVGRSEPGLEPLLGAAKVEALLAARWHGGLADLVGGEAAKLGAPAHLAATVACVSLVRPRRGAPLTALADLVEDLVA
jgi:hypothetical protein